MEEFRNTLTVRDFRVIDLAVCLYNPQRIRDGVGNNRGDESNERETEEPDGQGVLRRLNDDLGKVIVLPNNEHHRRFFKGHTRGLKRESTP